MKLPSTFESILLAELNIGLPPTSFYKLISEPDDWSFILKLHAIFECALARVLEKRTSDGSFDDYITFTRKVDLVYEAPELAQDQHFRSFLLALNFLRNRFAHNARYIHSDLHSVLEELPTHKRDSIAKSLGLSRFLKAPDALFTVEEDVKASGSEGRAAKARGRAIVSRMLLLFPAGFTLEMLALAFYFQRGKDGKFYADDFYPQLQDLLHDPAVIELRRRFESEFPGEAS